MLWCERLVQRMGEGMILDGGLATELEARGCDLRHPLWSAEILRRDPQQIADVHRAYLQAGAEIITTASYQATVQGLREVGLSDEEAADLLRLSAELALTARDTINPHALVAASIGPYGAYLANGAEYTGEYDLSEQQLTAFHRPRWAILAQTKIDLFACETIPSWREARALLPLITSSEQPAWVSFSCRNSAELSDGTPLERVAQLFQTVPHVVAIGINCTAPRYVAGLITRLRQNSDKPIIVYPNLGEEWDGERKEWVGESAETPDSFARQAQLWRKLGANIIGGCCRTTPAHIGRLARLRH